MFFLSLSSEYFSGMWEDDKASGQGTLEYSNGDHYEGEWENDQRNGKKLSIMIFFDIYNDYYCFEHFWMFRF